MELEQSLMNIFSVTGQVDKKPMYSIHGALPNGRLQSRLCGEDCKNPEGTSASPAGACSEVRRPWHSKALESAEFINSFRVHAIRGEPQSSHWLAQI